MRGILSVWALLCVPPQRSANERSAPRIPMSDRRSSAPAISANTAAIHMVKGHDDGARIRSGLIELIKRGRTTVMQHSELGQSADSIGDAFDKLVREVDMQLEDLTYAQTEYARKQLKEQQVVYELKLEVSRKARDESLRQQEVVLADKHSRAMDAKLQAFAAASGADKLVEAMARIEELTQLADEMQGKLERTEEELEASRLREATVDTLEKELREVKFHVGEVQAEANAAKVARDSSEARAAAAEEAVTAAEAAASAAAAELESRTFGLRAALAFLAIMRQKRRAAVSRVEAVERNLATMVEERDALAAELEISRAAEEALKRELFEAAAAQAALEQKLVEVEAAAASSQQKIAQLEVSLAEAESRCGELEAALNETKTALATVEKEFADVREARAAEQEARAAEQEAARIMTERAEAAEAAIASAKAAAAEALAVAEEAKQEIVRQQAALNEAVEKLSAAEAFAAQAREQVEALEEQVSQLQIQQAAAQEEARKFRTLLEKAVEKAQQDGETITRLQAELDEARAKLRELATLEADLARLKGEALATQEQLRDATADLERSRQAEMERTEEAKRLQVQLDQMSTKIAAGVEALEMSNKQIEVLEKLLASDADEKLTAAVDQAKASANVAIEQAKATAKARERTLVKAAINGLAQLREHLAKTLTGLQSNKAKAVWHVMLPNSHGDEHVMIRPPKQTKPEADQYEWDDRRNCWRFIGQKTDFASVGGLLQAESLGASPNPSPRPPLRGAQTRSQPPSPRPLRFGGAGQHDRPSVIPDLQNFKQAAAQEGVNGSQTGQSPRLPKITSPDRIVCHWPESQTPNLQRAPTEKRTSF